MHPGPLPPLAPGAPGIPGVDHPDPASPAGSVDHPGPTGSQEQTTSWDVGARAALPRSRTAPAFFPALGWWGFGLSIASVLAAAAGAALAWWGFGPPVGSVLAALAGAALALSIVGVLQARATGRLVAPAAIGASIAALALAANVVVAVLSVASGFDEALSGPVSAYSAEQEAFLDALADDSVRVYESTYDEDLLLDGYGACGSLTSGASPDEAARELDWSRLSEGRAVVDAATNTLCDSSGSLLDS